MPEDLKALIRNLPLPQILDEDGLNNYYKSVKFTLVNIPDPELGNTPVIISRWILRSHRNLKPGQIVILSGYDE